MIMIKWLRIANVISLYNSLSSLRVHVLENDGIYTYLKMGRALARNVYLYRSANLQLPQLNLVSI